MDSGTKLKESELINNDVLAERILKEITSDRSVLAMLFDYKLRGDVSAAGLGKCFYGHGVVYCIKRVISTAFLIALSRWKQSYDDKELSNSAEFETFKNSRYSKLFLSALTYEDVTLDLQVFSLIELWVSLNASSRAIYGLFEGFFSIKRDGESLGILMQQALEVAKNATFMGTSGDDGKYGKQVCNVLLYKLLKALRIFRSVKFSFPVNDSLDDLQDFAIRYSTYEDDVEMFPNELFAPTRFVMSYAQLCRLKGNPLAYELKSVSPYMLVGRSAFDNKSQIIYRSFDGEQQTRIEEIAPSASNLPDESKDELKDIYELKKFMCFNYKNIRQFSLVISDAMRASNGSDTQKILFDTCKNKYGKIVAGISSYASKEIYWDNLITLMIVEMGPSDFLELILDDGNLYDKIMENIGWRCIGHQKEVDMRAQYNRDREEIEKQCGRNKKQASKRIKELRITYIVRAMGFYEMETDEFNPFEESLSAKYDDMIICLESLKQYAGESVKTKECIASKNALIDIFKNMFMFLQMFYNGLDAYAIKKMGGKVITDENGRELISGNRKEWNDAFTERASRTYIEVKDLSLTQNYESFCRLCEEYNSGDSTNFNVSEKATRLKYLITRNYICDVGKLKYFATIDLSEKKKTTIFHMLENFTDEYWSDKRYTEWLTYFIDFFMFLIYNDDYYKRGLYESKSGELVDKDCDPIYPYMVTYYRENKDRDNLKKCCYRVPIPIGGASGEDHDKGIMVTLLTDDDFPTVTHFCIPLRYGSTDNWWINPFMIPAKGFMRHLKNNIKKITEKQ